MSEIILKIVLISSRHHSLAAVSWSMSLCTLIQTFHQPKTNQFSILLLTLRREALIRGHSHDF
jgi:hypothetical protein